MLYVRGCIAQADAKDKHKDLLSKEDIKKININFGDIRFDEHHTRHEVSGCRLIENTVTDYPIIIDNIRLKPGSWVATVEVDNPELENDILNHVVNGFSLFSYAGGAESYREVLDKSDVYPLFLSFVEDPANMIPFEVLTIDEYISKSSKIENNEIMSDEKSILDKIKELVNSTDEEPAIEKAEEAEEVEEAAEEPVPEGDDGDEAIEKDGEAVETQEEEIIEEPSVEEAEETEEAEAEAPADDGDGAIKKEATVSLDEIKDLLIQVITILTPSEEPEETAEEEPIAEDAEAPAEDLEEEEDEDVVEEKYIVKQATQKHIETEKPATPKASPKFDLFGRKLR